MGKWLFIIIIRMKQAYFIYFLVIMSKLGNSHNYFQKKVCYLFEKFEKNINILFKLQL